MNNELSPEVQIQFLRPRQLEEALRQFPVIYVPFGLIEWHGKHLPLGTDCLKAHAILVKCAERFGGVVFPPVYFYDGLGRELMEPLLSRLFTRFQKTGIRVILGVSGHNMQSQIEMINNALAPVVAGGEIAGEGLWEISLSRCAESDSDHAAKWESSSMLFFHPSLVDLSELGEGPLAPDMKPPDGIKGLDPRIHASAKIGERNAELAATAIGRRARELLTSLPPEKRTFSLPGIKFEYWGWM